MIDLKLQTELRERFNPDGSLLRRHQLRMLEMLKYIDKICQENDIPYWLSSGTCLGAVRHGGFIPWDDDLDIEMLGKDYDRFVEIIENQSDDQYVLQTHKNDPTYVSPWGKLRDNYSEIKETHRSDQAYRFRGIFIDIFPMEFLPYNKWISILAENYLRICRYANKINNYRIRKICLSIICFIVFYIIDPFIRLFFIRKDSNCLHHRFPNGFLKPRYIEHIFPLKRIRFEDSYFNVPRNVDKYLSLIYGDYMVLPNISDIHMHTKSILFLTNSQKS